MLVFSYADCKAGIIDEAVVAADRAKGTPEDPEVQALMQYFEHQDVSALKAKLCDDSLHYKLRQKAAALIGELGLVETIEFLQNQPIKDQRIRTKVRKAVKRIHEINSTLECPYCTEIIEAGATTCSQCGRSLS
jgi:ATP phosphoribosyltransferase regulatory subunit HisZ